MTRPDFRILIPIGLTLVAIASPITAQQQPDLQAFRLPAGTSVDVNGSLDESFWLSAIPITDFTQQAPTEGIEPTVRTEIRVAYDESALYIGAKLFDDPDSILAFQKRRDVGLGTDDRFMWIFDTFEDGRTGYFFETNANGLIGDGIISGHPNKSWNAIWEVRTARLEDGWSVEIRMPFSTFNFDPTSDSWGINFQRTVRRRNEEILWRGWRRNQGLFSLPNAGKLTGLSGLSQGLGLEVKPYATQSWRNQPNDADKNTFPGDVGVDVGYSITSGIRAAVSVNTDFAEVGVDQRRVNLTRFPLRFPEQRDFFLEGSGVFSFAPRSGPSPYFSRRIGLEQGQAIPLNYATRLGGQAGAWEMGFIQVGTGEIEGVPSEHFSVARIRRAILAQSSIGVIYTRLATSADSAGVTPVDRHTAGVDFDYQSTTFLGDKNLELEAFVAWNSNPDPALDKSFSELSSRGFRLNYPNDVIETHLSYREFGDDYSPAVGFVTRNNFRRVEPGFSWNPRPGAEAIRQLGFSVLFRNLTDLKTGVLEERVWEFGLLDVDFENGDKVTLKANRLYEYLDRDFGVGAEGIPILAGEYTNWGVTLTGQSARRRPASIRAEVTSAGFWDGDITEYSTGVEYRPQPGYSVGLNYSRNQVELPRGSFNTNLIRADAAWDINPLASVTANVQYDDVSEIMGFFGLAKWLVRPGSEIFVVYTHNWQRPEAGLLDRDRGFETLSRGGAVKVNYTWRW